MRSILLLVRPLTRAKDKTSIRIERIISLLMHKSANKETKLYLQTIVRNFHSRKNIDTRHTIMIGGIKDYTEEDIIELWVNGYYFHKDSSKRKELDDLEHFFMPDVNIKPLLKSILLHEIIDACQWAKLVDDILVKTILPNNDFP